jgi:predicted nucleic acid-binding protein
MDRVFLDANILFSAAFAPRSRFLRFWEMTDAEAITSAYAVEEARRNLRRKRLDRLVEFERLIGRLHIVPEPDADRGLPAGVSLPEDDRPILLAAIAAQATHLLTGNHRDFDPYYDRTIEGVLVLQPADYPPAAPA